MTILLDKEAFRRFTPKEMHDHMKPFDAFLVNLSAKEPSLKRLIDNPLALFPVDEHFPIIHIVALFKEGCWNYFTAARERLYQRKELHRFVNAQGGDTIAGMNPILRLEVVSDQGLTVAFDLTSALKVHGSDEVEKQVEVDRLEELTKTTEKPSVLFSAPLAMMKKGLSDRYMARRFTLYQHILGDGSEYPENGLFYVGITAREWKRRWAEHRAAIMRGSRLKFHRAYGDRLLQRRLTYVHHKVMAVTTTLVEVQNLEEAMVAGHWEDGRLLNMIPGGRAGIRYMHEHGMLGKNVVTTPDDVETALEAWMRDNPRRGLPAPWVAKHWEDDDYALKIICGPEGRLSIDQVLTIRIMSGGGMDAKVIAERIGARNTLQVQRVIDGKTYGRVK